ncbi:MAG TPA: hypothetical protein VMW09_00185 [Desulfatiglandales bacterium]|nr:hypothetical protein [Desulfatiglandales bacterium]
MQVISLEEYRRAKRIQGVIKKHEILKSAREAYKEAFKEELRKRLRERMRLEELKKKQSEPTTKKTPI